VILDHQIEQVGRAQLDARVERFAVPRLLDVAKYRLECAAALSAEQAHRTILGELVAQLDYCRSRRGNIHLDRWSARLGRASRQCILVVGLEQSPGPGIALDDIEQRLGVATAQLMSRYRLLGQGKRVLQIAQATLAQPALVEREATDQVLAQGPCCPDAELCAALGLDPVTDGDDHVEVVEGRWPIPARSNMQILHIAFPVELALSKHVPDVSSDNRLISLEQVDHLSLREPHRLMVENYLDPGTSLRRLVNRDLAPRLLVHSPSVHEVTRGRKARHYILWSPETTG